MHEEKQTVTENYKSYGLDCRPERKLVKEAAASSFLTQLF